ncbi:MAG TPA: Uma2 family endonuclease [Longimicrobium sp.]|nr:Uma2 family endonuclease [Longimicrobium sp.]
MTADELLAMPDDGIRRELVEGELREMTPAGWQHGRIAGNIAGELRAYIRAHRLGVMATAEASYRLSTDPDTVRIPDVSFVRQERVDEIGDPVGYWPGVPDLAFEVISPNDRYSDVRAKVDEYLAAGTPMVVLVDPRNREVVVFRASGARLELTEDDVLEGGDVVPGWRLPVRDIFG